LTLTAKDAPADRVQGLVEGARDYVVKPFSFEVRVARIRALLRCKEYLIERTWSLRARR
jgi:DNA-binding response OmpR family regulator